MFVTVFYGILNTSTGEIEYVNGGHNPPYIISASGLRKVEMTGGPILGCMEDFNYKSKKLNLLPGDRLFLFTDGVTEAFNSQDQAYGDDRLEDYLQSRLTAPIENLVKDSMQEINTFSIGMAQSDDITYLAISYHGQK
jgi:sigma-B regulation protein RsbU (phosphoserine phosphatase)